MFKKKKEVMKEVTKHVRDNFVGYIGGFALIATTYGYLKVNHKFKNYVNKSERDINDAYRNGMSDGIKVVQTNLDCEEFMNDVTNNQLDGVYYADDKDTYVNSITKKGLGKVTPQLFLSFGPREDAKG